METRKKVSMTQVLVDVKPYVWKTLFSVPTIRNQDIESICLILLGKYKNVEIQEFVKGGKPFLRIRVKGLFTTEKKEFAILENK